jgi:MoaA/NifB/PqqE/SkfB family radical SAM enzyme
MQVEWEVTMKCNYNCFYCSNLDKSIHHVTDQDVLRNFIKSLGDAHPGVEVFLFGGEPFVHPEIGYIIKCFNEFNIPFVIQTNLSKYSIAVMKTITDPYTLQVSIHPTEITHDDLIDILKENINCRVIDVMFSGKEALWYYLKVKEEARCDNIFLTPITDFGDGRSDTSLHEYLELKHNPNYNKIIRFEEVERLGKPRSELWANISFSPKGKPCLYKDKYFLYGPNLEQYNCCYRIKTDGICPKSKCFLM